MAASLLLDTHSCSRSGNQRSPWLYVVFTGWANRAIIFSPLELRMNTQRTQGWWNVRFESIRPARSPNDLLTQDLQALPNCVPWHRPHPLYVHLMPRHQFNWTNCRLSSRLGFLFIWVLSASGRRRFVFAFPIRHL
jgi:hypothetical protein